MSRNLGFLVLSSLLFVSICESAIFNPVSDSHRSAALELLSPSDGSFGSLEETYEALRILEVLAIEKKPDLRTSACTSVAGILRPTSSALKDLFNALRVNSILKCEINDEAFVGIASKLKGNLEVANSLVDFYYLIGALILIKDQNPNVDVHLGNADKVFRSIKALSQSDGRWRYSSNNPESSADAAGIAIETLAGVVSLASSEIDHSLIATLKNDIVKLFDSIERYGHTNCTAMPRTKNIAKKQKKKPNPRKQSRNERGESSRRAIEEQVHLVATNIGVDTARWAPPPPFPAHFQSDHDEEESPPPSPPHDMEE